MQTITIQKREIPLRFDMTAYEMIEARWEGYAEMLDALSARKTRSRTLCELIAIFGNAALIAQGREPDLTHDWVASNMSPRQRGEADRAVGAAIREGMRMEEDEADEAPQDVVLEELEAKKNGA